MQRLKALKELNAKLKINVENVINIADEADDEKVYFFKTSNGDVVINEADLLDKEKFDYAFATFAMKIPATVTPGEWSEIVELINQLVSTEDEDIEKIFESFECTDSGNAEAYAETIISKFLYIPENKQNFLYAVDRWKPDNSGKLIHGFKNWTRQMHLKAFQIKDEDKRNALLKHFLKNESHARIKAMEALVKSEPGMSKSIAEFDTEPGLLNLRNGVLDLYNNDLLPHRADFYLTKITPVEYKPGALAPAFMKFMEQVTNGDKELQNYIQKAIGYALTGSTEEQCIFILYGTGANGKSTFIETIKTLMAEYAVTVPVEALLSRASGMASEIVRLRGARLAITGEPERGAKLSEGLIKILTGGDTVTGRGLYKDSEEFTNHAKIMLVTNHLPQIAGTDEGIWRRIRVIPFTVTIPEEKRDKKLLTKLKAELPGILNWAVEGCSLWQQEGLESPQIVKQWTGRYRDDQDTLRDFLDDCMVRDAKSKILCGELYAAYTIWCMNNSEPELARKVFTSSMEERGFQKRKGTAGNLYFYGITQKDSLERIK